MYVLREAAGFEDAPHVGLLAEYMCEGYLALKECCETASLENLHVSTLQLRQPEVVGRAWQVRVTRRAWSSGAWGRWLLPHDRVGAPVHVCLDLPAGPEARQEGQSRLSVCEAREAAFAGVAVWWWWWRRCRFYRGGWAWPVRRV